MLRLNKEDLSVEVVETLSFEHHVQPELDGIIADVRFFVNDPETDVECEDEKNFLAHKLTNTDKLAILQNIIDNYEFACGNPDYSVSIFDCDGICKAINDWIELNFYFRWD